MNYRNRKPSHHGQPDRGATYPPYPFMVVNNQGLLVDFDGIKGELFDKNTKARFVWGIIVTLDGKVPRHAKELRSKGFLGQRIDVAVLQGMAAQKR